MTLTLQRRALLCRVTGSVQGVGFRPFAYRLARELELDGWVRNEADGVHLLVAGDAAALASFVERLRREAPPAARIAEITHSDVEAADLPSGFAIAASGDAAAVRTGVMADLTTCPDCLNEVLDPGDRRHLYPFANCTACGPRYSIVTDMPYDRPHTTMRRFAQCPACRAEYEDPANRRFHAQPNACPVCGPHVALWNAEGGGVAERADALRRAAGALREGRILAAKGLGGFHLMVDACNEAAVRELRARKHREEKPFALLCADLDAARGLALVSPAEADLLRSPAGPIVLLARRPAGESALAPSIAPGCPCLGVMLPPTPLHHLLLRELGFPVVATSGNRSDEPICFEEAEALRRLRGIADLFLVHDRPVARAEDDSVARIVLGRPLLLRRARGYAPLPVPTGTSASAPATLAVGAHFKNTVALSCGADACLSQHLGDLDTPEARRAFDEAVPALSRLYRTEPVQVACDLHPDYHSTRFAHATGLPRVVVQHHYAHVLSVMAEHRLDGRVLGVAWDGTGLGTDGTVWGGEFLLADRAGFRRIAHLHPFRLPGGDRVAREPRRSALGLLHAYGGRAAMERVDLAPVRAFAAHEREMLAGVLEGGTHAPLSSSMGRLFDGVASLLNLRQYNAYEGQAAMALEFATAGGAARAYDYRIAAVQGGETAWSVDWRPLMRDLLADLARGASTADMASAFHHTLAAIVADVALRAGYDRVALGGGCFQNALLLDLTVRALRRQGLRVYWPQAVPPNDGGLALGQLAHALHRPAREVAS